MHLRLGLGTSTASANFYTDGKFGSRNFETGVRFVESVSNPCASRLQHLSRSTNPSTPGNANTSRVDVNVSLAQIDLEIFFFFPTTWRLRSAWVKRSASFHSKQIKNIFFFCLSAFVCRCPLGNIRPIPENKTDTPVMILLDPLSHNSFNDIGSSGRTAATSSRSLPFRHVPPFLFFLFFLSHFLLYRVFFVGSSIFALFMTGKALFAPLT